MKKLYFLFMFLSKFFMKVDAQTAPEIEWQKCLGGISEETAYNVQQTLDGGFIAACVTLSNDGDVSGNHSFPYGDDWIVKLSASGAEMF